MSITSLFKNILFPFKFMCLGIAKSAPMLEHFSTNYQIDRQYIHTVQYLFRIGEETCVFVLNQRLLLFMRRFHGALIFRDHKKECL